MFTRSLIAALVTTVIAGGAHAQEVRQFRAGDRLDPREVARIIGQPKAQNGIRTRSLRVTDEAPTADAPLAREEAPDQRPVALAAAPREDRVRPARPAPTALSLPVQFRFDSADILPEARTQLDELATGILLLPQSQRVVIEGHTDNVGADAYNIELSNRRALAVKRYLVIVHRIDGERLTTEGYGKFRPINAADPASGENRRVQFRGG